VDLELRGRRVLITGGSMGIGLATARAFAHEGARLALAARNSEQLGAAAAQLHGEYGVDVATHAVDLAAPADQATLADVAGDVDVLINNAGSIPHGDLWHIDEQTWRAAWELKVFGYINLTRLLMPQMLARGSGVVVNVIGAASFRHRPNYVAGASGNTALLAFTEAMGSDSMRQGVRVVGVSPGLVATERMETLLRAQAQEKFGNPERWGELVPADPPPARPEQIADVVTFLASARADHISGIVIAVDAGRHLR
jgi:NAD(P)-dependent dehydrogenase (short-subunit alcohol dehydrogenase family)